MPCYPAQPSPIGGSAQKKTVERIRAGQDMLGVRRPARSLAPLPAGGVHTRRISTLLPCEVKRPPHGSEKGHTVLCCVVAGGSDCAR
jgi:hypothetical protein